jgi:uncharacterized Fe-S cluster-containing MiaB family protein
MATAKRVRTPKSTKTAKSAETPEVAKITTQAVNLHDVIRERAYQIFESRGCYHGRDFDDWMRAESEVLSRFGARSA